MFIQPTATAVVVVAVLNSQLLLVVVVVIVLHIHTYYIVSFFCALCYLPYFLAVFVFIDVVVVFVVVELTTNCIAYR